MPKTLRRKMYYTEAIQPAPLLTGVSHKVNTYSVNGLFDPTLATGGHQAKFFDQAMVHYAKYTVVASKIRVTVLGPFVVPSLGVVFAEQPVYIGVFAAQFDNISQAQTDFAASSGTAVTWADRAKALGLKNIQIVWPQDTNNHHPQGTHVRGQTLTASWSKAASMRRMKKETGTLDRLDPVSWQGVAASNPNEPLLSLTERFAIVIAQYTQGQPDQTQNLKLLVQIEYDVVFHDLHAQGLS